MLNETQVINILGGIPKGIAHSMQDIYKYVSLHCTLVSEDLAPYTDTRKTNVPHWHNVVQKAVFHLKEKGTVQYLKRDAYVF